MKHIQTCKLQIETCDIKIQVDVTTANTQLLREMP